MDDMFERVTGGIPGEFIRVGDKVWWRFSGWGFPARCKTPCQYIAETVNRLERMLGEEYVLDCIVDNGLALGEIREVR